MFSEMRKMRTKHRIVRERKLSQPDGFAGKESPSTQISSNGFDINEEDIEDIQFDVTCSYTEIYNEQIHDLLDQTKQVSLNIREDAKKGIVLENETTV